MELLNDNVTFYNGIKVFCPDCKSRRISEDKSQPAFNGSIDGMYFVLPLRCDKCGYYFSVHVSINN